MSFERIPAELRKHPHATALRRLHEPGNVFELKILNTLRAGTVRGYFDGPAAAEMARWEGKAPGVYTTLNPVNSALLARASNRLCALLESGESS
jgi:hypothetical protein